MNRNHFDIMSPPEDSEVSTSEDSEMSSSEDSEMSISQDSDNSVHEDSKFKCFCGWTAKLRVSHTMANPGRLFYNCSKSYNVSAITLSQQKLYSCDTLLCPYCTLLIIASNADFSNGLMSQI